MTGSHSEREAEAVATPAIDGEPLAGPEEPRCHLRVEAIGDVAVVHVVDTRFLGEHESGELGDQLDGLVEKEGRTRLLLDLGNVQFLSSAALTRLVQLKKKVAAAGGKVKLCSLPPVLAEVFRITRVENIFEIHRAQQDALDAF